MKETIITLKFKYSVSEEESKTILNYIKNYNNILHYTYNRIQEGIKSTKELTELQNSLNNIFVDSWFKSSSIIDAKVLKSKVIFGGKKLFIDRCKGKISKDEFQLKRLVPLCSVGEANKSSNRKFKILNKNTILFKPNRKTIINLKIENKSKNYRNKISKLIELQNSKSIPITYKLGTEYIYISFDNSKLESYEYEVKENRVIAIDMNPNYIGYSVADWKSENKYKLIKSGVFDLSKINSMDNGLHLEPTNPKKIYITNKREFELIDIAHKLFKLCVHFKCESFAIENLNFKQKNKGNNFNKLVNNQWNRTKFVSILRKLVCSSSTNLIEVQPQYSSILGNLIYRHERKPDMVLASIEIGRRAYEFSQQYIIKIVPKQKNIIQPNFDLVKDSINQSLEELKIESKVGSYKDLFFLLKESKLKYRFSLDDCRIVQCCFSKNYSRSKVKCYNF